MAALRFASEAPAALSASSRLGRERDSCPLRGAASARLGGQCWARRGLVLRCQSGAAATTTTLNKGEAPVPAPAVSDAGTPAAPAAGFTVVMKFGGSSVASADRMREVADLVLSFPEETPVVVLSAMGKTTNYLLLAGDDVRPRERRGREGPQGLPQELLPGRPLQGLARRNRGCEVRGR